MTAPSETRRLGLVDRMARTWSDPRGATRLEIATADESRLFFYAFAASALGVLTAVGEQTLNPAAAAAADPEEWFTAQVAGGLFIRPLGLYLLAALIGLACRAGGGQGSWRATRAASFWTAFVAASVGLLVALLGAAATGLGDAPAAVAETAHALGAVLWAVLLAPALAEAHGFRSARGVWIVFGVMAVGVAVARFLL
jgi:hypothetical protein